jgi:hypothetical protein
MKPSQVCKNLRTKKMFVPAQADAVFAQENGVLMDAAPCWCNRTLTETGPDDKQVGLRICSASRSCFEE